MITKYNRNFFLNIKQREPREILKKKKKKGGGGGKRQHGRIAKQILKLQRKDNLTDRYHHFYKL
jgi:hypothetical protein